MKKLYEEEDIREIACAIRAKCGSDQSYKVCDMAKAIEEISSGSALTPKKGFVIEELDEEGNIKSGTWYGETVYTNSFCAIDTTYAADTFTPYKYLTNVNFADDVVRIGNYAFQGCSNLALTSLPESVRLIGGYAFKDCFDLALTSLPEGVTKIDSYAFQSCGGLTSITFKGTPSSIYSNAFSGCNNLKTINVPWAQGAVAGAPWGATNATINYNYTE